MTRDNAKEAAWHIERADAASHIDMAKAYAILDLAEAMREIAAALRSRGG